MRPPETHPSLIARLQGPRDEPAWDEFVAAYEPFLRHVVERHDVPDRHIADIVQQILWAVARSVEKWTNDGRDASFRRWLRRVARNVVIKFMSRERRQALVFGGTEFVDMLQNVVDPPSNEHVREFEHELVIWAAHQVRDEFRETSWRVFWETAVMHRPIPEVAEEFGVSVGSIYMTRSRIMARIRTKVAEIDGD